MVPEMSKIRPMGKITADMELLLDEMIEDHDLQWHEILYLVYGWLKVHRPDAQEVYTDDGKSPEFYYGPKQRR